MRTSLHRITFVLLAVMCCSWAHAQEAAKNLDGFQILFSDYIGNLKDPNQSRKSTADYASDRIPFILSLTSDKGVAPLKLLAAAAEETRVDKQVGGSDRNNGSTSIVTKGSVPSILGIAVENGGISQAVNGTTVTFRGNPSGLMQALSGLGYFASNDPANAELTKALRKFSFALSFDTSRDSVATLSPPTTLTGIITTAPLILKTTQKQLSEWSIHVDAINHRDPRDARYRPEWNALIKEQGQLLNTAIGDVNQTLLQMPEFQSWRSNFFALMSNEATVPESKIESTLQEQLKQLTAVVESANNAALQTQLDRVEKLYFDLLTTRSNLLAKIGRGPILSFDYTNSRPLSGPSLSNFRTIFETWLMPADFTFNGSITLYNETPSDPNSKRLRDFQFSSQFDFPLATSYLGAPIVLSFGAKYERLLKDTQIPVSLISPAFAPSGLGLSVPTVLAKKGDIALAQAKLVIPIKGTGTKIPLSLTWANRSELVRESHTRANVGVTFDLDTIFSKAGLRN